MKRRAFLATGAAVALAGCSFGSDDGGASGTDRQEARPPGGGSDGETATPPEGGATRREDASAILNQGMLLEELQAATAGDIISVPSDVHIDLQDRWTVTVPSGVTLDGGGDARSPGAVLRSPEDDETPADNVFKRKLKLESGARLTGFRIESTFDEYVNPEEEYDGDYYAHRGGGGVTAKAGSEVDNNEISGWPYAAVFARGDAHIHDNYIHHNAWEGLGYGVAIPEGNHMPVIESNRFNYNRHSITGAGGPQVGFIARYNVVGEDWLGSQFDMHGTEGMVGIAGGEIIIERNTFRATHAVEDKTRDPGGQYPAIDIRGTPTEAVHVEQNWFYHETIEDAYHQPDGPKKVYFEDNHFGRSAPNRPTIGAPATVPTVADSLPEPPGEDERTPTL